MIKVFLLATALESDIVSPNTRFNCENGEFRMGNRVIPDTHRYGTLSVSNIIVKSSNIGAVKIGLEVGYERYYEYLTKFGFGNKTGVDLIGERAGFVRPVESAGLTDRVSTYFGYGIEATSLQLVTAMAAIANGGRLMKPFVVKAVTDQSGKVIREYNPQMVRRVLSPETALKVSEILEDVATTDGTAPNAAIKGYRVAGKTGTAKKIDSLTKTYSSKNYVASFVGFVPADKPRLVIHIMIDEPQGSIYGGDVSAPVFNEVGTWALSNLGIQPELRMADAVAEISADIQADNSRKVIQGPEEENILPDFRGLTMREVLRAGTSLGLEINLKGTGLAVDQVPKPGTYLEEIKSVMVSFKPPV